MELIQNITLLFALLLIVSCQPARVIFQENPQDWKAYGDANWNYSDNELIGTITDGAGFVITQQPYQNFSLELEFKPDSTINSGVFIRCQKQDINPTDCYELNIWDLHPDQDSRTGAIVTKTKPLAYVETLNQWNTYKIEAKNDHLQVWVNGVKTADAMDDSLSGGYIGLQASGTGEIRFRKVKIRSIK
ncbi:MAG: DUF1080 domain-containing protein [Saprospiraceae bacterium]